MFKLLRKDVFAAQHMNGCSYNGLDSCISGVGIVGISKLDLIDSKVIEIRSISRCYHELLLAIESLITVGSYKLMTHKNRWTALTADVSFAAHFEHSIAITRNDKNFRCDRTSLEKSGDLISTF